MKPYGFIFSILLCILPLTATAATRTTRAKAPGAYSFKGITAGRSYAFQATAPGYRFEPQFLTVHGDITNLDFIGQ